MAVALPLPIDKQFIYTLPTHHPPADERLIGLRVRVPFGKRLMQGVICDYNPEEDIGAVEVKPIEEILDSKPLWSSDLLDLLRWAADYYHSPLGSVLDTSLPTLLRKGHTTELATIKQWSISDKGELTEPEQLHSRHQKVALEVLAREKQLSHQALKALDIKTASLESLVKKDLARVTEIIRMPMRHYAPLNQVKPVILNQEQSEAVSSIGEKFDRYGCFLLDGPTNSGKTEVYIEIIKKALSQNKQVLYLLPEISLSPQTVSRLESALKIPLGLLHSGLTDRERLQNYLLAREEKLSVIVGTRSAIFTPMPNLSCIIIDEEQDHSYKQHDRVRYNCKHLAIKYAQQLNIPIILGSATPSLETLHNVERGYYQHLQLPKRGIPDKKILIEDCSKSSHTDILSKKITDAIGKELEQKRQVLVFINRRGFASVMLCRDCNWIYNCPSCDRPMVLHKRPPGFICHLCDRHSHIPERCPSCDSDQLLPIGGGTQRIEDFLTEAFPNHPVLRIDRDSMHGDKAYANLYQKIHSGQPCILVGTQILAKGHDFTNVFLGIIANCDQALINPDFHATESFAQTLVQVIGRIGRRSVETGVPARIIIPTHYPDNELLTELVGKGYKHFARTQMNYRKRLRFPPYAFMAYLRAESRSASEAISLLKNIRSGLLSEFSSSASQEILGPNECAIAKQSHYYRYVLIIKCNTRNKRKAFLQRAGALALAQKNRHVRWHINVDPVEAG